MQVKNKDISHASRQTPASINCKCKVNTWLFEMSSDLTTAISSSELGQIEWRVTKLINVLLKQHDFVTLVHAVIPPCFCSELIYPEKLYEIHLCTDPA